MSVRDELRDPWGWVVAATAGGLGWAVLAPVVAPAGLVGLGIGAAVLGAKVAMGAGTSRPRRALDAGGVVRPDDLPKPDPGSSAGRLLARGQVAVARITQLSEAPGDPWLRDQVSDVDDEAEQALARAVGRRGAGHPRRAVDGRL